jgi:2-succinyl-5-enolpyruvyl-6-hydroxy-3-cyclohexene-1-carboxylate synthase
MDKAKVTQSFAATFVDELARHGVRAACVSPGSRSTPLAMALARHPDIKVYVHVDERSGSFFGLGLAKASWAPVVLLCTSGTAAAEFHPAVVEAYHSGTPLVVLTADRPPELRDVGANQAIDQARIYGSATRWYADPGPPHDAPGAARQWRRLAARAVRTALGPPSGPVHVNLPFREPLTPEPGNPPQATGSGSTVQGWRMFGAAGGDVESLLKALAGAERPLLVAGAMPDRPRPLDGAARFLAACRAPLLAEPSSHLRSGALPTVVAGYDALLRDQRWAKAHRPDLIVRLGAVPTSKALNQWLASEPVPTVLVDAFGTWEDPDYLATTVLSCHPAVLLEGAADALSRGKSPAASVLANGWCEEWVDAGRAAIEAIDTAMARTPMHEGHAVRALSRVVPKGACVMVGSSMPIRDVDTFWPPSENLLFFGNRGASGIDGLVSTGLGIAAAGLGPTVLLLGDLSVYHDMNGLLALRRQGLKATIVVLDNDGGGIFNFLPQAEHSDIFEELFATPIGLDFERVAGLYGLAYSEAAGVDDLETVLAAALASAETTLVRIPFTRQDSVAGHRACWHEVSSRLTGK